MVTSPSATDVSGSTADCAAPAVQHIRDLSPQQWGSGIAAWLGWLFDGLDMHLYTLVYARFLSALGIGGEWAVGASLLSETWPKSWRAWIAAVLQSGVNIGILLAVLSNWLMSPIVSTAPRYLFLVGIIPALLVFWVRRAVPEPEEWHAAKTKAGAYQPKIRDLFRGE